MKRRGWVLCAATLMVALGPARAAEPLAGSRTKVISTGMKVELTEHLRKEGTTLFLFLNDTSTMEQKFLADLEKRFPEKAPLGIRVVRLQDLQAEAARQHEVTATPTAVVLDRFGRPLARTSDPDDILKAVGKGLRMARIRWIDEEDPKAPEVYGRPAEALKRGVPGIVKTMSLRPDVMQMFMQMSRIHFSDGFLDRKTHELIAAYVSALNECRF